LDRDFEIIDEEFIKKLFAIERQIMNQL